MAARFLLGRETSDHVMIVPLGGGHDGWLEVEITVQAGGFGGRYRATLATEELAGFRDDLRHLHTELDAGCELDAYERWILLSVKGDGIGHFHASGVAREQPDVGNELHFALDFDQTDIMPAVRDLDELVGAYPSKSPF